MNLTEEKYIEIVDYVHDILLDYEKGGYTNPNREFNKQDEGGAIEIREYDIYKITKNLNKTQFNSTTPSFIEHPLLSKDTYTKEETVDEGHIGSRVMQLIPIKDTDNVLMLSGYRVSTKLYNRLATKLEDESDEYLFELEGLERY